MTAAIPAIDIAPFLSGNTADKAHVAREVAKAAQSIGFVVLSGHGIPQILFDTVFEKGLTFFDLPDAEKSKWHPTGSARQRGYHGVATRGLSATLGKTAPKDLRESLFLGPIDNHAADPGRHRTVGGHRLADAHLQNDIDYLVQRLKRSLNMKRSRRRPH